MVQLKSQSARSMIGREGRDREKEEPEEGLPPVNKFNNRCDLQIVSYRGRKLHALAPRHL